MRVANASTTGLVFEGFPHPREALFHTVAVPVSQKKQEARIAAK
jgi:hypothetical protein